MIICPFCAETFEPTTAGASLACPACGRSLVDATEEEPPPTSEVDLNEAKVLVAACPKCAVDLVASDRAVEGARFGRCESCGFVFVLTEETTSSVSVMDPRVASGRRLLPLQAREVTSAEEMTGANADSGIRARSGPPPALLVSDAPPMRVVLSADSTLIGRIKADITIDSPDVSRRHAVIEKRGGTPLLYVIKDLGSTNGTYVNGQRVEEAPLQNGDRVVVGQSVFYFQTVEDGEGVYLLLAMAPSGRSAQLPASQKRCLEAWNAALAEAFAGKERDVLSSEATGRALAILPFEESATATEMRDLARQVLEFPRRFIGKLDALSAEASSEDARVAIALGPARRVVQDGRSKLTGEIIQRISSLFVTGDPARLGGVVEEASLRRLLAPEPEEPVDDILRMLGFAARRSGAPEGALFFEPGGEPEVPPEQQMEELCEKARVGLEAEIAGVLAAGQRSKKLAAKLAQAGGGTPAEVRLRSRLYKELLPAPIFVSQPLLVQWIKHLEEGGRMLDRFEPIRALFDTETLAVVASALRLLPTAFHGISNLADLELSTLTSAASTYLRTTEPEMAGAEGHPLSRVLALFAEASETPRDEGRAVELFEFLVLLALIRALRTRGDVSDIDKAKSLLDHLRSYATVWGQMLREDPREARPVTS